ncbi:MAG: hypothetical protein CBB71_02530 [Rhodopirellula sp. TMED11]|nr:MAG: hypothetical protein CBB71_02530 [Rhodopirellula sp. TMED11]
MLKRGRFEEEGCSFWFRSNVLKAMATCTGGLARALAWQITLFCWRACCSIDFQRASLELLTASCSKRENHYALVFVLVAGADGCFAARQLAHLAVRKRHVTMRKFGNFTCGKASRK